MGVPLETTKKASVAECGRLYMGDDDDDWQ